MKQPKKFKRDQKIEISKLRPDIDLTKYRLVSWTDEEIVLTDSKTNTEKIIIKR